MSDSRRRRAGWSISDQALSSLTNFLLSVLAARALDQDGFGGYAVALATYFLAVGVMRAVGGEVLIVRHSSGDASRVGARAFGAAVLVGVAGGAVLVGIGAVVQGSLGGAFLALGLTLPGLLLQDTERYYFVAAGHPAASFANDAVWAVVQFSLIAYLLSRGIPSVGVFVGAWGAAAVTAAVFGLVQSRLVPHFGGIVDWFRSGIDLWPRFLAEFFATTGAWQLSLFAVGGLSGLAALGALRGAQVLYGPLHVVNYGARLAAVPEGARDRADGSRRLMRLVGVVTALLVGIALAWTVVVSHLPEGIGRALLGDTWPDSSSVALPFGLFMTTEAAVFAASVGLRVLADAQASMRAAAAASVVLVSTVVACAVFGTVVTISWGLVGAGVFAAAMWWRALVKSSGTVAGVLPLEAADG